ncbi:MAG: preprotein translocase subunit SecG [Chloroflexi bacterium]|nr:preprotein translocase subunit SecG [Chloroflexota bacterium]
MSFAFLLHVFQILAAVLLVALILLQVRTQGLGGMFGQGTTVFRVRRGLEKTIFQATIALGIIFILLSILSARFTSPA